MTSADRTIFTPLEATHHLPTNLQPIEQHLHLNGNVRGTQLLTAGMSDGVVMRIDTDMESMVVKYNPNAPHKVRHEIAGFQKLQDTPLGRKMVTPTYHSEELGVVVMPYFEGQQLRDAIRNGTIDSKQANSIIDELMQIKKDWWSKQEKVPGAHEGNSMQRNEWTDTTRNMQGVLNNLAQKYGLSPKEMWTSPIVFQDQEYPSLLQTAGRVHEALQRRPPYLVMTHGDATGANILFDPKSQNWKMIDAEWAGLADPAEAFVRMTKYISTTTASNREQLNARIQKNRLHLDLNISFPPAAVTIQKEGIKRSPLFSHALQDPNFIGRSQEYLAGSYLRELALADKRGYPEMGLFAMLKAAEAVRN